MQLGRPKNNIGVTYLAFADDLQVLSDNETTAIKQIETLKECTEKVSLQISFPKIEFYCSKLNIHIPNTKYDTKLIISNV